MFTWVRLPLNWLVVMGYILALSLTILGSPAFAVNDSAGEDCQGAIASKPLSVENLVSRGLDPSAVTFLLGQSGVGARDLKITMFHKKRTAGKIILTPSPLANRYNVSLVGIGEDLRGKGVGTLLYLIAARLVRDELGATLRADRVRSDDAVAVWNRFIKQGIARDHDGRPEFINAKLADASDEVFKFFIANLMDAEMSLRQMRSMVHENAPVLSPADLRKNGLPLAELKFGIFIDEYLDNGFKIYVHHRGDEVAQLTVSNDFFGADGSQFSVVSIGVDKGYDGKGLGSMLYLVAARLIHDELGSSLRSDSTLSASATSAWERFVAQGIARRESSHFSFQDDQIHRASAMVYPHFLESLDNREEIIRRVRDHIANPPE